MLQTCFPCKGLRTFCLDSLHYLFFVVEPQANNITYYKKGWLRRVGNIMITILNEGGDLNGSCSYRIQVGKQYICKFEHNRLDGLGDCLQKAVDAVELSEWCDFVLLDEIKGG